jgi:maleamate amidohydrolase
MGKEEHIMSRPWDGAISKHQLDVYEKGGFGNQVGFGRRPAVVIIDVQYRTVGQQRADIFDAIEHQYPTACGEFGWSAVDSIAELLSVARPKGIPVVYPHVAQKSELDAKASVKNPLLLTIDEQGYQFVEEVKPHDGDLLIPKNHPSAFFGTPMLSYLIGMEIDTLILTGCTTSGCVRATAIDAKSYSYRVIVPEECVYDRGIDSHKVNLFDIDSKYGDVMPLQDVTRTLQSM